MKSCGVWRRVEWQIVTDVPDYAAAHNCLSLKRKALLSSETSVTVYQLTFHNIVGDLNLQHLHHCETLQSRPYDYHIYLQRTET